MSNPPKPRSDDGQSQWRPPKYQLSGRSTVFGGSDTVPDAYEIPIFPAGNHPPAVARNKQAHSWESCGTMPLVGGFSRGYTVSPAPSFRCRSIFTSITHVDSQDLAARGITDPRVRDQRPRCQRSVSQGQKADRGQESKTYNL
ncbi:hypothetical protein PR048_015789 [Dryococelus australis]|uniref:Uncharacterized protein n=1 Tax=Dryococelus australis TaxID=614101 RepID=A0ABQ9HHX1_9NEOP|nr:hypothetical protein PR048_015789 [Dryococelus australis]